MGLLNRKDSWRIPDDLWAQMEPLLPPRKPHPLGCHNPRVPDRDAMNAILLVLRTGMQWNALKLTELRCSSSAAHRRFREWTEAGVFDAFWRAGLLAYDELVGLDWSFLSMDGATTKAPLGGADTGPNPTDRGKCGTKRSILTDTTGIPVGLEPAGANRNDFKLFSETLENIPPEVERPEPTEAAPQGICLDKGYDYPEIDEKVEAAHLTPHMRRRGEEASEVKKGKARRWVVERTHSWMNRFRRILTRWEKREDTYLAMLHLACGLICYRAIGLLG